MTLKAINVEKRINSLQFNQRNKQLKDLLLGAYGSFEEMALCGVEGYERSGYVVPITHDLITNIILNGNDADIESLKKHIEKGLLSHEHVFRACTPEELRKAISSGMMGIKKP